jgi:hypothetical protein
MPDALPPSPGSDHLYDERTFVSPPPAVDEPVPDPVPATPVAAYEDPPTEPAHPLAQERRFAIERLRRSLSAPRVVAVGATLVVLVAFAGLMAARKSGPPATPPLAVVPHLPVPAKPAQASPTPAPRPPITPAPAAAASEPAARPRRPRRSASAAEREKPERSPVSRQLASAGPPPARGGGSPPPPPPARTPPPSRTPSPAATPPRSPSPRAAAAAAPGADASPADHAAALTICQRGRERLLAGDAAGARTAFEEAIARDPRLAIAHRGLGLARAQQGDARGAIQSLRLYLRLDPAAADRGPIRARIQLLSAGQ